MTTQHCSIFFSASCRSSASWCRLAPRRGACGHKEEEWKIKKRRKTGPGVLTHASLLLLMRWRRPACTRHYCTPRWGESFGREGESPAASNRSMRCMRCVVPIEKKKGGYLAAIDCDLGMLVWVRVSDGCSTTTVHCDPRIWWGIDIYRKFQTPFYLSFRYHVLQTIKRYVWYENFST